jgi:Uma2 family endonuclease
MSHVPALQFTYQDYLLLPEDKRYEIIDGDLLMTPAPTTYHQRVLGHLYRFLDDHVREHDLGEVLFAPCDVYLSEVDIVQPDVLYVSKARLGILEEKYVRGAPDLTIEVFEKATAARDRVLKAKLYAKYGVKEYWLVDLQAKSVEVLLNAEAGFERQALFAASEILRSSLLPQLRISLADVF